MRLMKKLGLAALVAIPASTVNAGLLEVLRDNGSINAEQYSELASQKAAKKAKASEVKLIGRFYADFAHYQDDKTPLASGAELRTARLEAKGKYKDNWKFKAQFGLDNDGTTSRYIWLGYQFDNSILKAGRLSHASGISNFSSSRYITFMERAMPVTAFAGDFQQGLEYNWWNDNSGLQVSALLDTGKPTDVNDLDGDGKTDDNVDFTDEKFGVNARYSFAPILSESNTLHLGLWTRYINPPSGKVKVRSRPESHVTDTRLISTSISNVDGVNTSGVEVAWIGGPLSFQAEYQNQDISTTTGTDVTLNGYYVSGSYFLTGHTRNYDVGSGTIGRTKLNGEGAVELAIRYSELDLSEGSGGIGNNVTLGVNWWPRKNIKLAFNQIFAEVDQAGTAADEDIGISQVRAQIDF